jgi:hypothetical protein
MYRIETWTIAILLGAAVALYNLFSGWTIHNSAFATIVVLGLVAAAPGLFVGMLISGRRDRRSMLGPKPDARVVLAGAARAIRWSGAFAVGICVLLFANCSSAVGTGQATQAPAPIGDLPSAAPQPVIGAVGDVHSFLSMAALVLVPLVIALLLPPILATAAQLLATSRPDAARRLANLTVWGSALAAGAAVATVPVGFFLGVSACDFGTSVGACAAGLGSLMNFFSLGSLALFLPYTGLITWALARMAYDRANQN